MFLEILKYIHIFDRIKILRITKFISETFK